MSTAGSPARLSRAALALSMTVVALAAAACGSGPAPSPVPSVGPVTTPDGAVAAIRARTPWFDGIGARNPDLIGQGSFWTADAAEGGIRVTFEVGWGDCQAGCIDRHTWTWDVDEDGTVTWVAEDGSELTPDLATALTTGSTTSGVGGRVTGGPTCPVERPGDPACAGRLVSGAVLVVKGADGNEVARFTTDESGFFRIALPAGDYLLEAAAVEGFMSGPSPTQFTVSQGALTALDLSYDTGIR
jgi:hypothetical protein